MDLLKVMKSKSITQESIAKWLQSWIKKKAEYSEPMMIMDADKQFISVCHMNEININIEKEPFIKYGVLGYKHCL